MAIINILALVTLVLFLGYKAREKFVDAAPTAVCLLILTLYLLAFFKAMSAIDFISAGFLAAAAVWFIRQSEADKNEIRFYVKTNICNPGTVVLLFTIVLVTFLVRDKIVTWWDDYNFWATDIKSLFFLDGFAGKYANVAPEFGDYPPGTQLFKWWFAHFSPDDFHEGLMFAGYYSMNLVFMGPLLRRLRGWNVVVLAAVSIGLFMFPSVAESFYLDGTCADLTMALIYGAFLAAVLDQEGHRELFYYGRLAVYLCVLMLVKNVAFIWVAFGLLFMLIHHVIYKLPIKKWLAVAGLAALTEGSWLLFCLSMRRVAKLTGTAFRMFSSGVNLPGYAEELISAYQQALVSGPLHRFETAAVDITPLGMYLLVLLLCLLLFKKGVWNKKTGILAGIFLGVSGIIYYGILLISHLTIFAIETQYLEPFGMISSIERYGAPLTVGSLYLIAFCALEYYGSRIEKPGGQTVKAPDRQHFLAQFWFRYQVYLLCLLFIILTADHQGVYRSLWGYRDTQQEELVRREEILDDNAHRLITAIEAADLVSARVLYLKEQSNVNWVQSPYISFLLSPVSMITGYVNGQTMSREEVLAAVEDSHAQYLYANQIKGLEERLEGLTKEVIFSNKTLYRIERENGQISLVAYQ